MKTSHKPEMVDSGSKSDLQAERKKRLEKFRTFVADQRKGYSPEPSSSITQAGVLSEEYRNKKGNRRLILKWDKNLKRYIELQVLDKVVPHEGGVEEVWHVYDESNHSSPRVVKVAKDNKGHVLRTSQGKVEITKGGHLTGIPQELVRLPYHSGR